MTTHVDRHHGEDATAIERRQLQGFQVPNTASTRNQAVQMRSRPGATNPNGTALEEHEEDRPGNLSLVRGTGAGQQGRAAGRDEYVDPAGNAYNASNIPLAAMTQFISLRTNPSTGDDSSGGKASGRLAEQFGGIAGVATTLQALGALPKDLDLHRTGAYGVYRR